MSNVKKLDDVQFNKIREDAKKINLVKGMFADEKGELSKIDIDLIKKLKERNSALKVDVDSDTLYVERKDPDTDAVIRDYIPELIDGFTSSNVWLSDLLPEITFDVNQDGNLRKASELDAMYKVVCVCSILGEDFSDILESVVVDGQIFKYDFQNMDSLEVGEKAKNFRDALKEIQKIDTLLVKSIISACSYKLNDFKEKKDSSFTSLLSEEESSKLTMLTKIYCSKILQSDKILYNLKKDKKPKLAIVKEIDRRDNEIRDILESRDYSDIVTIFKISKLSSSNLGTIKLRKLEKFSIKSATEISEKETEKLNKDDLSSLSKKIFRRLSSECTRELRIDEYKKYKNDVSSYKLPIKGVVRF